MLSKIYRLKSKSDFARVSKTRNSAYEKLLGVKVRENQLPHSRFGIVVGLKVSKKAPERNKIKRRIREIIRKNLNDIKSGHDIMVLVLKPAVDADYSDIENSLIKAFKKVKLFK